MTDYNIRYTNPVKTGFVIPEGRSDGPVNPNTNVFMPGAVAANTTLNLLGRGWPLYGEHVWQDLVYMTEHFANSTPPSYAIEGQLWYNDTTGAMSSYDGATWTTLLSSNITGDLNMNSYRITNLGLPIASQDAVPLAYLQGNYVNRAGDIMTGSLTMVGGSSQVILPNQPTIATHATNKAYVDGLTSQYLPLAGGTLTGPLTVNSTLNVTGASSLGAVTTGALTTNGVLTANSTTQFNGASTFSSTATFQSPVTIAGTTLTVTIGGSINMSGNVINGVGSPVNGDQAANKAYVDALAGGSAGQVITGGNISTIDGVVTLTTSGGGTITLTGTAAPFVHTHQALDVAVSTAAMQGNYLNPVSVADGTYPTMSAQRAVQLLDIAASVLQNQTLRYEEVGAGSTTVTLPFVYRVGANKLQVFLNGVLQVLSRHAEASIIPTTGLVTYTRGAVPGSGSDTPYAFNITVAGSTYVNVGITLPAAGFTFGGLAEAFNAAFATSSVPATSYLDNNRLVISSNAVGAGASVILAAPSAGTDFVAKMATHNLTTVNQTVSITGGYNEVGTVGTTSRFILFAVAPTATDVVTAICAPHIGSVVSV